MSEEIAQLAAALAERLPDGDLRRLETAARTGVEGLRRLRAAAASPSLRAACQDVLHSSAAAGSFDYLYLAGAVAGARAAVTRDRAARSVDVVWTGPSSSVTTGRLTSATVIDLVEEARNELLLVSYATRTEPIIAAALDRAVARRVDVVLVLERPEDNSAFGSAPAAFPSLRARRLAWPTDQRPSRASLHAKLLVVDGSRALVGSANVTERAFHENLECGVLLRGGDAPGEIRDHVLDLLDRGVLVRV